ncbi:MAG: glycosyltransferase family 39 protein [Planctomycetota bacterium]
MLLLCAGVIGLSVLLRFFKLLDKSLWIDEASRFFVAKKSIADIIFIDGLGSFSPPLHNILLHFWYYMGDSEFIVRLFPLVFGLISIVVFFIIVKKLYSKATGDKTAFYTALLATFFLAVSPMHIHYSQEAGGPYTLYFLFILISMYLFLEIIKDYPQKQFRYFLYFAFLLAICFYLHYFTVNFILAYNLIFVFYYSVFVRHKSIAEWLAKSLKWFFSQLILLVAIIPILPTVVFQASRGQPGPSVSIRDMRELFFAFVSGQWSFAVKTVLGITAAMIFAGCLFFIFKRGKDRGDAVKKDVLLLSLFVAVIGIGFLIGIKTHAFRYRYLFPLLAIYVILLARGTMCVRPGFVRIPLILFVLFSSMFSLNEYYFKQPYWEKEPWRDASAFVGNNSLPGDIIVFPISNEQPAFNYYYRKCDLQLKEYGLIRDYDIYKGPVFSFDVPPEDLIAEFERLTQATNRIWVVTARITIGMPTSPKGIGHLIIDYMNSTEKYDFILHRHVGGRLNVFLYGRKG